MIVRLASRRGDASIAIAAISACGVRESVRAAIRIRRTGLPVGRRPRDGRHRRVAGRAGRVARRRDRSVDGRRRPIATASGACSKPRAAASTTSAASGRASGRRFVQVQVAIDDVRQLPACGLLAWSSYALTPIDAGRASTTSRRSARRRAGAAAAVDAGTATELVAFKLHVPSRIRYQNVKLLDGTNGTVERGNILTWEQTADRSPRRQARRMRRRAWTPRRSCTRRCGCSPAPSPRPCSLLDRS